MPTTSARHGSPAGQLVLLAVVLIVYPFAADADDSSVRGFALRHHNPFLQIFGLPTFQSPHLAQQGEMDFRFGFDIANNSDFGDTPIENFVMDGESYFLTASFRRRMTDWLELGVDLPYVSHSDGFMDNMIENWHNTFGMSNTKRNGPSNLLNFLYERDGETVYQLTSPESGIGDIQLTAAVPIREGQDDSSSITLRSSLKLPTGDADKLLGSGATDLSLGLYASTMRSLMGRELGLAGFGGALFLGDGDVLPALQKSTVPFGGFSATWQASERFALASQLYVQGAYFDSDVEELGGETIQLTVGLDYRSRGGTLWRLAVVEDMAANATTDFALHFSIHSGGN